MSACVCGHQGGKGSLSVKTLTIPSSDRAWAALTVQGIAVGSWTDSTQPAGYCQCAGGDKGNRRVTRNSHRQAYIAGCAFVGPFVLALLVSLVSLAAASLWMTFHG